MAKVQQQQDKVVTYIRCKHSHFKEARGEDEDSSRGVSYCCEGMMGGVNSIFLRPCLTECWEKRQDERDYGD